MALSARRKHVMNRFGAIIKNLQNQPENFTLDKQLGRLIDKVEARMKHTSETKAYRKARNEARAEKAAAEEVVRAADPIEQLREIAHISSELADSATNAAAECDPHDEDTWKELQEKAADAREQAMRDAEAYSLAAEEGAQ